MGSPGTIIPDAEESFWEKIFHQQNRSPHGKRTDYPLKHDFVTWEYTLHNDGSPHGEQLHNNGVDLLPSGSVRIRPIGHFDKGLSTTRFHKGFQRRMQPDIRQDAPRLEREAQKQQLSSIHFGRRRQRLGALDERNGFNLITGKFDPTNRRCTTPFHLQPRTRETGGLSEEAERSEYLLLRDSMYKFHAPAWSGDNHDLRQDLLQRDGLNKQKKSSLLGIGSADLPSAGAKDMFSKSLYDPGRPCPVEGLVEKTLAGRFTPRKLASRGRPATTGPLGLGDCRAIGQRAAVTSTTSLSTNTVFRVLPTGLGNGTLAEMAKGNCTAAKTGIPPRKPVRSMVTSQSAPTLTTGKSRRESEGGLHTNPRSNQASEGPKLDAKPISASSIDVIRRTPNDESLSRSITDEKTFNRSVSDLGSRGKGQTNTNNALESRPAGPEAACGHLRNGTTKNYAGGIGIRENAARGSASVGLHSVTSHSSGDSNRSDGTYLSSSQGGSRGATPSPAERRQANRIAHEVAAIRSLDS